MQVPTFIVRVPKESEMSLSNQVKESVSQAAAHLREALAFAARSEHPITIASLADLINRLETLESMDDLMTTFAQKKSESKDSYRG